MQWSEGSDEYGLDDHCAGAGKDGWHSLRYVRDGGGGALDGNEKNRLWGRERRQTE